MLRDSFALGFAFCLLSSACTAKPSVTAAELPNEAPMRTLAGLESADAKTNVAFAGEQIYAVQATSVRSTSSRIFGFSAGSSAQATTGTQQLPNAPNSTQSGEMIDIQARFAIQCDSVNDSAEKFRTLVAQSGGRTTDDEANATHQTEVTFEVRVPSEKFEAFAAGLVGLGVVQARDVKRRDVSKEFHDSDLLLHEREAAFARYEEILKGAKDVKETVEVEKELDRLRTDIDRIKGDIVWLKDRVASATVRVRFFPSATSDDAIFAPSATLYPAIRAMMMFDLRSESQRSGYIGGGASIQFKPFGRALTLDVDIAHSAMTDRPTNSDYAYIFLGGLDLYSDLLGGGRRTFLNPFLGFRAGYAITNGSGDFAFGGVVGVDLVKTKLVLLDLHARILGLVGNDQGPHVMIGPELGFSFAF